MSTGILLTLFVCVSLALGYQPIVSEHDDFIADTDFNETFMLHKIHSSETIIVDLFPEEETATQPQPTTDGSIFIHGCTLIWFLGSVLFLMVAFSVYEKALEVPFVPTKYFLLRKKGSAKDGTIKQFKNSDFEQFI